MRLPHRLRRRPLLLLLSLLLSLSLLFLLYLWRLQTPPPQLSHYRRPSPSLEQIEALSKNETQKYVLFHQLRGAGFNNQLQESQLLSYLAARSGRAYVYRDIVWRPRGYTAVPAEMFFAHPLTSEPAVHEDVFRQICKGQEVQRVEEWPAHGERVGRIVQLLEESGAQCVEVTNRVMDWRFLESPSALALYEPLLPHIRTFQWSSAVLAAHSLALTKLTLQPPTKYLALHLRRGDFKFHCPQIAAEGAGYNLWARLPFLPDGRPEQVLDSETVMAHCWPSFEQILERVAQAKLAYERRTGEKLEAVYVLHDAKWDAPWVWILLRRLEWTLSRRPFSMRFIDASSLPLQWEERDLGIAVDMEIARQAEVFVGNGFSSLTSNVVLLRLADGKEWESIRFW